MSEASSVIKASSLCSTYLYTDVVIRYVDGKAEHEEEFVVQSKHCCSLVVYKVQCVQVEGKDVS